MTVSVTNLKAGAWVVLKSPLAKKDRQTNRQTETERDKDRERQRQRERHRERERVLQFFVIYNYIKRRL